MAFNQKTNTRKGLDLAILDFVDSLNSKLWTGLGYTAYGLAELIERDEMILPEVYESNINYSKIFLETGKSSTSFFITDGSRDRIDGDNGSSFSANVDLFFSLNLKKIKPSIVSYRAKENVIEEITNFIEGSNFFITSISTDLEAIDIFTFPKKMSRSMHPNLFLKFKLLTNY